MNQLETADLERLLQLLQSQKREISVTTFQPCALKWNTAGPNRHHHDEPATVNHPALQALLDRAQPPNEQLAEALAATRQLSDSDRSNAERAIDLYANFRDRRVSPQLYMLAELLGILMGGEASSKDSLELFQQPQQQKQQQQQSSFWELAASCLEIHTVLRLALESKFKRVSGTNLFFGDPKQRTRHSRHSATTSVPVDTNLPCSSHGYFVEVIRTPDNTPRGTLVFCDTTWFMGDLASRIEFARTCVAHCLLRVAAGGALILSGCFAAHERDDVDFQVISTLVDQLAPLFKRWAAWSPSLCQPNMTDYLVFDGFLAQATTLPKHAITNWLLHGRSLAVITTTGFRLSALEPWFFTRINMWNNVIRCAREVQRSRDKRLPRDVEDEVLKYSRTVEDRILQSGLLSRRERTEDKEAAEEEWPEKVMKAKLDFAGHSTSEDTRTGEFTISCNQPMSSALVTTRYGGVWADRSSAYIVRGGGIPGTLFARVHDERGEIHLAATKPVRLPIPGIEKPCVMDVIYYKDSDCVEAIDLWTCPVDVVKRFIAVSVLDARESDLMKEIKKGHVHRLPLFLRQRLLRFFLSKRTDNTTILFSADQRYDSIGAVTSALRVQPHLAEMTLVVLKDIGDKELQHSPAMSVWAPGTWTKREK